MAHLAFVGVGIMGAGMARRLIDTGHDLTVWNRRETEHYRTLLDAGATGAASISDALQADVVFSMLADDSAVLDNFTAEALAEAGEGTVHVNMATVSLDATDRLEQTHAAHGVGYLAAPVLGRPEVAAAGQVNVVVGGDAATVAKVEPYLEVLGKRVWHMGDRPRAANLVKLAVNYNLIHAIQALAESVTLVEEGGVDGQTFVDLLTDAAFTGSAYTGYGNLIAARAYDPHFRVELGMKDLQLVEAAAEDRGVTLPSAPLLHDLFQQTLDDAELGSLDWSAVAEITRRLVRNES